MKRLTAARRRLTAVILVLLAILALPILVWAAGGDPAEEITLGPYALPLLLVVVLGIVYKIFGAIPDRWKSLITIGVAIGLSMLVLAYRGEAWAFQNVVDYVLYGLMTGAAAIGLYESKRALMNPRA